MINLENFDEENSATSNTPATPEEIGTGPTGVVKVSSGLSKETIYDRMQKMVYVFDVSGSMQDGMVGGEIDQCAIWTQDILDEFIVAIQKKAKENYSWNYYLDEAKKHFTVYRADEIKSEIAEHEKALKEMKVSDFDSKEEFNDEKDAIQDDITNLKADLTATAKPTDEMIEEKAIEDIIGYKFTDTVRLKTEILNRNLDHQFKIKLARTAMQLTRISKIEVVKTSTKKLINERLDKYPDADIMIIEFEQRAKVRKRSASRKDLMHIIDTLRADGGGTNIFAGVNAAVEEIKIKPAIVGANHIVLVTDGYSGTATQLPELLPTMKAKNIVLDLICVEAQNDTLPEAYIKALTEVSAATGGIVVRAGNANDLERKMFEVSTRLMIPAKL